MFIKDQIQTSIVKNIDYFIAKHRNFSPSIEAKDQVPPKRLHKTNALNRFCKCCLSFSFCTKGTEFLPQIMISQLPYLFNLIV